MPDDKIDKSIAEENIEDQTKISEYEVAHEKRPDRIQETEPDKDYRNWWEDPRYYYNIKIAGLPRSCF